MKIPIVTIPTYWTRKGNKKKASDVYFDHPTPLDGQQTLTRALDSFKKVKGKFKVIVLSATVDYGDDKLYKQVEAKIEKLIKPYKKHFPVMQFGKSDVTVFKKRIKKYDTKEIISHINLSDYPSIRNFQLILSNALQSDVMIGIDDDEIVMPTHIKIATEFIGKKYKNNYVYGSGGFYKDKKGNYIISNFKKPKIDNIFYAKRYYKNLGFIEMDKKKGRLNKSNFVFGGNMIVHRKMFMQVPYDPNISRGENMDYLINAQMNGFDFYFDKELYIMHMPPEKSKKINEFEKTGAFSSANLFKLKEDIYRFIYERQKIKESNNHHTNLAKINIKKLEPYPGRFFNDKLIQDAEYALINMYPGEIKKYKIKPKDYVHSVLERVRKITSHFFLFNKIWKKFMVEVKKDKEFTKYLEKKWK